MTALSYGFERTLTGVSFADAAARVTAALKMEGFGVLTEIDIAAAFKTKLDVDFRPYVILGACNPALAHKALQHESQIGLLLPCNVVVQEVPGGTSVSIADPKAMFKIVDDPSLASVAEDAEARLRRVLEALG